MKVTGLCNGCRQHKLIVHAHFIELYTIGMINTRRTYRGAMCEPCARAQAGAIRRHMLPLLFIPGPWIIGAAISLVSNGRELRRLGTEIAAPAPAASPEESWDHEARAQLPWATLLDARARGLSLSELPLTPLSLTAAIAVLAALGFLFGIIVSLNPGPTLNGPETMRACGIGCAASIVIALAAFGLYSRGQTRARKTDFLSTIIPPKAIYQYGRTHFTLLAINTGRSMRLLLALQNRFDAPTTFHLHLRNGDVTQSTEFSLAPTEVAFFLAETPCAIDSAGHASFHLSGRTSGTGGRVVRSLTWLSLTPSSASELAIVGMALSGHIHIPLSSSATPTPSSWAFVRPGGWVHLKTPPECAGPFAPAWHRVAVSGPDQPLPASFAASVILRLLDRDQPL